MNVEEMILKNRLVAILRGIPEDMLCDVLDALYDGGVRLAEITYDFSGETPERETAEMIRRAAIHTEGKMMIGAGTVTRISQVEMTKAFGGRFIISPNTDRDIIEVTKKQGLISMPGAMTVSEVCAALNSGADFVKIFPASSVGGISFIKNVLAPLKGARLIAVGGIKAEEIPEYLANGCAGVGVGSPIANTKLCLEGRLDVIRSNAEKYSSACRK